MVKRAKSNDKFTDFFGMIRLALFITVLIILVFVILFNMFFVYVQPYENGVLLVKVPIIRGRGVREKIYEPGLHFILPFNFETMHRFNRKSQVLELTDYPTRNPYAIFEEAVNIQTSDGFFVTVDISVIYRISNAYKIFTNLGPGDNYLTQGILPKVEPILRESFGKLNTEDFYNSPKRTRMAIEARERLNDDLKHLGIEIEHVLVRYFKYSDEIQRNIEEKKLMDQLVFKNQSEAEAARASAEVVKVREEGQAEFVVSLEEGKAYVQRKNAEMERYVRTRRAEADLLIALAEAKRTQLKNDALIASIAGSNNLVGLELAALLENIDIIVLPSDGTSGVNPLDIDSILKMLEVRGGN